MKNKYYVLIIGIIIIILLVTNYLLREKNIDSNYINESNDIELSYKYEDNLGEYVIYDNDNNEIYRTNDENIAKEIIAGNFEPYVLEDIEIINE
ncbi:MAG: hypothetical protein J6A36_03945 [Clostridia bacterium]|nr:hypothetical protein [Clostridia bacterium]